MLVLAWGTFKPRAAWFPSTVFPTALHSLIQQDPDIMGNSAQLVYNVLFQVLPRNK